MARLFRWDVLPVGMELPTLIRQLNRRLGELARNVDGIGTAVSFSAALFSGDGAMTWTVQAADVSNFTYTLLGKRLTVEFYIGTSSVGGGLSNELFIRIPGGFQASKLTVNPILLIDNGARTTGYAIVSTSHADRIGIARTDGANFSASADLTTVAGQITFEVR